ncbi:MAG: bifunctional (p)ppGpp synthetase/guanosine-3',5'-bis(diphosphate) 3'-pyrophosphohydrolase, partial [Eubacteriales bacterium]|nr:bifunctional (p)ppGpp synthetase/guanosine-3',5'-bis(diphosphate) 3'-pyrophosphohydrolase [Eubacteriales bacterium]
MTYDFQYIKEKVIQYNIKCSDDMLEKAYQLSQIAHKGQQRQSGEPFIIHPLEVANILIELELDCVSIIAALLHDTVEDTRLTIEEIKAQFGDEVSQLVDGVTKLGQINYISKEQQQAENLRKMFLYMAKDIRVIMIKLADRLHNMRTLKFLSAEKQHEKAQETLEIYAPIAHRLGIFKFKWELEDLSLRYLDPDGYYNLVDSIAQKRKEREEFISHIKDNVGKRVEEIGVKARIEGRPKNFYSIYKKMRDQAKTLDEIYDIFAIRIIVDTVQDCYAVLGLIHEIYRPIPGRFKDYIAMPKPNMYQSLHTTLMGEHGTPFEVQIRTWEMHKVAETGIAAHWRYKEGGAAPSNLDNKLAWLRQMLDWQKEMPDAGEFMETLKVDLFTDEVFVFTPKGDVINLPAGSTPIDFAYAIHSAVGNRMIGAKINSRIVPLGYELANGDIIEILTSTNSRGPSRDWLKIVKSSQARNKINQWFKKEKREENIEKGKLTIERELKKHGLEYSELFKDEWVDKVLKRYNFKELDDIYAAVGFGAITANKIISKLKEDYRKAVGIDEKELTEESKLKKGRERKQVPESGIVVKG